MAKQRPGKKPSTEAAIESRRIFLRGGKSVREMSRIQYEVDMGQGETPGTIRNRMSWAKDPESKIKRMIKKAPASVEAPVDAVEAVPL